MEQRALSLVASLALFIAGLAVTTAYGRSGSLGEPELGQSVSFAEASGPEPESQPAQRAHTAPAGAIALNRLIVRAHSARAVSRAAPAAAAPEARVQPRFGAYVYSVSGTEEATGFGRRSFPPEMTMTIHRMDGPSGFLVFDLTYSPQHEERAIVSFGPASVALMQESSSVTFTIPQKSECSYAPPVVQVPLPLEAGTRRTGTTNARSPDGATIRTLDWTSEVTGREVVIVAGQPVETWVVRVSSRSRPGTLEQEDRTRTYWYDPGRALWVKWSERLVASKSAGPGKFSYTSESVVTLKREPG